MSVPRRISEHRPILILATLCAASLTSLAWGAQGKTLGAVVRGTAEIASAPFLAVFNTIDNGASYLTGFLFSYEEITGDNREMHLKLTEMIGFEAQRRELIAENQRLRNMMDFQRTYVPFSLMPANVIQHASGILTIDRGSLHGLRQSLCVITSEGVIGYITQVGLFTSNVITLQNADCRIDSMVRRSRARGRVHGTGNDLSPICTMYYIDLNEDVREGDQVVTSPDSVFPAGYPIGQVKSVPTRGRISQSADLVPAANPFSVDEVFILIGFDRNWKDLAGKFHDTDNTNEPPQLFEMSSIQERFAP